MLSLKKKQLLDSNIVKKFALMLPNHYEDDHGNCYYYIITDDWMERKIVANTPEYVLPLSLIHI